MSAQDIAQKTRRIAYAFYEQHPDIAQVAMVGIWENGYLLAQSLQKELQRLGEQLVPLAKLSTQKKAAPWAQQPQLEDIAAIEGRSVVWVVDDVMNTGRTLWVALQTLMRRLRPEQIEIAVLVARTQNRLPISPQYVGTHLPTTLNQYVEADLQATQSVYMHG